jgi:trk system potassium uptake protein TrkH
MIIQESKDFPMILKLCGYFLYYFSFILLIPILIAFFMAEWGSLIQFSFTFLCFLCLSLFLISTFKSCRETKWVHGMASTAICWIVVMFISAIPLYFSGHFAQYLDACFDVMSGITTTGLSLVIDMDHLPISVNVWRHLLIFIGGQGIIVMSLVFLSPLGVGFQAMVGEGKDERLLPNIKETSKAIWVISLWYLLIGTIFLSIAGVFQGLSVPWSLFHAVNIYMSAWGTGGFAPQSQNLIYYHNPWIEGIAVLFMILGCMNFGIHYQFWFKSRKELFRDIETKTMLVLVSITTILLTIGLLKDSIYSTFAPLLRKGLFLLFSAHTGTGQMTIYSRQFITQWGDLGLLVIILAMIFGGSASSTAGGFKAIRVGLLFKGIVSEIKKFLFPRNSVVIDKFHHFQDIVLTDKIVRSATTIIILYMTTHLIGTIGGLMAGYPLADSFFEAVSATANVGLSCGITNPAMPAFLKVIYILNMWLGRLEFSAVFVFFAYLFHEIVGRWHREKIN